VTLPVPNGKPAPLPAGFAVEPVPVLPAPVALPLPVAPDVPKAPPDPVVPLLGAIVPPAPVLPLWPIVPPEVEAPPEAPPAEPPADPPPAPPPDCAYATPTVAANKAIVMKARFTIHSRLPLSPSFVRR